MGKKDVAMGDGDPVMGTGEAAMGKMGPPWTPVTRHGSW